MEFLIQSYTLTNFDIQEYYRDAFKLSGVYSRNKLPVNIKDGAYVINLDECVDVGTHWVALFCRRNCSFR